MTDADVVWTNEESRLPRKDARIGRRTSQTDWLVAAYGLRGLADIGRLDYKV